MILKLYECDHDSLEIDNQIWTLEIENQHLFVECVQYFLGKSEESQFALIEGDKALPIKDICVISNVFELNLLQKTLLSKLHKIVEKDIIDNFENKLKLEDIYASIKMYIDNIINQYNFDLTYQSQVTVKDFLNFVDLKPIEDEDYFENLLSYISLSAELKIFPVIVFVNQKAFLSKDQLEELFQFCLYKKQRVILIENTHSHTKFSQEKKLHIDKDQFELIY